MRGTTEGANLGTGAEEGSPKTPVANDVIKVAGVWLAEGLAWGSRWGRAGKGGGGDSRPGRPFIPPHPPVTSAPGPCAPSFRSVAPHPRGPGVRPPAQPSPAAHEVPGRRLQCSSRSWDLGEGAEGGGERGKEAASGTPSPSPRGEVRGPILPAGTPRVASRQPWPRRSAAVWDPVWGVGVIGDEWVCVRVWMDVACLWVCEC